MQRFEEIDWERISKVLRVVASFAVRDAPDAFDCGISAEDLVNETLAAFFLDLNCLGWKPAKGKLERFLIGVLKHKAKDHLRRQEFVGGSLDDEERKFQEPLAAEDTTAGAEYRSLRDRLYKLVGKDQELRNLIAATELISRDHNVNQQLAEVMDKIPREVVKLKRRLLNVPGVKDLLYG